MSALLAGSGHSPFRSTVSSPVQPDQEARTGTKRPSSTIGNQQRRKKHPSACPIGGCGHASPKLKWHVYHHLPNFLCPQEEHTGPKWSETLTKRTRGLRLIAHILLGSDKLDGLVNFTNDIWQSVDSPLSKNDRADVGLRMVEEGWERVVPTLQLINAPAILTHWCPLAFLWDRLSSQQREAVTQLDCEPCPPAPAHSPRETVTEVEMAEPGPPTPATPTTSPLEPSSTGPVDDPNSIGQVVGFDCRRQHLVSPGNRMEATRWSLAVSRTTCFPLRVVLLTTVTRISSLEEEVLGRSEARIGKWLSESIPKERRITRQLSGIENGKKTSQELLRGCSHTTGMYVWQQIFLL